ncbi:hypothetical protein ACVBCQ_001916, partial [Escherichia albertii]
SPRHLRLMTNRKLPDALRLSGLHGTQSIEFALFCGWIRRLHRIRHKQSALCQQTEAGESPRLF